MIEFSLRVLNIPTLPPYFHIFEWDQYLFHRNRKNIDIILFGNKVGVTINSNGFRYRNINIKKPKRALRICCLGDSITFGYGVDNKDTFSSILEKKLNKISQKTKYEVINCGVIGQCSYFGLKMFKKEILPFKPDIIIVSYALNDNGLVWKWADMKGCSYEELPKRLKLAVAVRNYLFPRSNLYRLISRSLYNLRQNIHIYFQLKKEVRSPKRLTSRSDYKNNLKSFIRLAEKHNMKIIFFFAPVQTIWSEEKKLKFSSKSECLDKIKEIELKLSSQESTNYLDYFHLGNCYQYLGKKDSSKEYYYEAINYEPSSIYRKGALEFYSLMKEVAQSENIPFVDVNDIFFKEEYYNINKNLFFDIYHAGEYGHKIIGNELFKTLLNYKLMD